MALVPGYIKKKKASHAQRDKKRRRRDNGQTQLGHRE